MSGDLNNWPRVAVWRTAVSAAAALCCWLLLMHGAAAGTPVPYGEYFVRLGEGWSEARSALSPTQNLTATAAQDGADYRLQLSVLEQEGGPYADALAEPLADLARLSRQSGDVDQARQLYQRALHVVRINDGLYSERQVPILRELFETYRAAGDMAALDARYDYYFRLYGNGRPPYSGVRLAATLEYLGWQREALWRRLDKQDTERLLALYNLNEKVLEGVAGDDSVSYADYRELTLSQLRNLYLLQSRYEPAVEVVGAGSSAPLAGTWTEQDTDQLRLESFQRGALSRGREILAKLIARTPPGKPEALAAAYLELADWNQWNDRRIEAQAAYGEVVTLLAGTSQAGLLQQWFGQPVELPANGAFWQPRPPGDGMEPIVVRASFDVSARGRAGNIEATAVAAEYQHKTAKFRRKLAQTRFRPLMRNGQPAAEAQLVREYQLLN